MPPGGVQEIITYFAGMMQLFEEPTRDWFHLLYPAEPMYVGSDLVPIGVNPGGIPGGADQTVSFSTSLAIVDEAPFHFLRMGHYHVTTSAMNITTIYIYQYQADQVQIDKWPFYPHITGTQPPITPFAENVAVDQTNKAVADQLVGLQSDNPSAQATELFHPASQVEHMVGVAQALIPDGFDALNNYQTDGQILTTSTIDPLGLVNGHDAFLTTQTTLPPALPFGEYVNGVYDANFSTPFPQFDLPTVPGFAPADGVTITNGWLNPGVEVIAGSNAQQNIAGILDANAQHDSLIVLGNSYSTDAIFQTNILHDVTSITTAAPDALSSILNADNHLNNFASFINGDSLLVSSGSSNSTPLTNTSWHVDVVNGDFYNVNMVSQLNVLDAGSVSFQTTQSSFYEAITGANQQVNQFFLSATAPAFDMVIVLGNYQNANIIDQTNVALNDSIIQAVLGGDHSTLSVSSGGNTLANEASITAFPNNIQGLSAQQTAEAHDANNGFNADIAGLAPAVGQPNVLFVTGNYYDINLVSQTNVLSDPNIALQLMGGNSGPGTASETISTGGNQAVNIAQIIDVNTLGTQFLAGAHYSDSMLVQANILENASTITTADPHALVSEVIAFLGHDAPMVVAPIADTPGVATAMHHDPIAGVMS